MKRTVLIVLVAAVVLLVAGCSLFEKSYYNAFGDAVTGMCHQVTTNDSGIQDAVTGAGWVEGTCANHGFAGTHYCENSTGFGGEPFEIRIYYGSSFTTTDIEGFCSLSGWTYH